METINKRRSIRTFQEKSVEKEKIEKLLRAAMQAPSAFNQQVWEFIVVQEKETLGKLAKASQYAKPAEKAPLAIVVLANQDNMKVPECWQQDLGAATQNILLEAVEQGLGGVWMAVAPIEERMNYIRAMFNLPDNIVPYAIIPLGYPVDEAKFIDRYDPTKVHYEKW